MKGLGGGGGGGGRRRADEMANLSNMFDAQTAAGDQRQPDGDTARRRATAYCKAESKKRKGNLNRRMRASGDWDGGLGVGSADGTSLQKANFQKQEKKSLKSGEIYINQAKLSANKTKK